MINMKKEKVLKNIDSRIPMGIAHRGLHNEMYTENGLNAFKNAVDHNLPLELDVHLSKDNQLIVCHDADLIRTTGKAGIIEDLTVKEIKDNYKLLDGSEVPTFKEVLDLVNEQVPIIIELKCEGNNGQELAKRTNFEMKDIKDPSKYMYISFDPRALIRVKNKGIMTGLLVSTKKEWTYMFRCLFDSVDLDYKMIEEKRVRKYQKKHFVNVWTIENEDQLKEIKGHVDTITFQLCDPELVKSYLINE